jgi:hypothetical protein
MKLFTINRWKVLGFAIAAIVAGWLVLAAWPESAPPLPRLALVSIEPAEMTDESGRALWLVTFTVNVQPGTHLKDVGKVIEAGSGNSPSGARGIMAGLSYSPTQQHEGLFLIPVGTTSCRVSLKYAASVRPIFNQISIYVLTRFPVSIRRQIANRIVMKWFAFQYVPGKWREASLELALPPQTALDENR